MQKQIPAIAPVAPRDRLFIFAHLFFLLEPFYATAPNLRLVIREPLGDIEAQLDPQTFRRIHRSTIVNVDPICELRQMFHGGYQVILRDGFELKLSDRFRENLGKDLLGKL
jgi:DNA-binding LytR/AlgR family response regulator